MRTGFSTKNRPIRWRNTWRTSDLQFRNRNRDRRPGREYRPAIPEDPHPYRFANYSDEGRCRRYSHPDREAHCRKTWFRRPKNGDAERERKEHLVALKSAYPL